MGALREVPCMLVRLLNYFAYYDTKLPSCQLLRFR
jgi:hypothetical protein